MNNIGIALDNLKRLRKNFGMTQKEMAGGMGISESFYCQLEGGKRKLTVDHAFRIAEIFDKSLDDIFLNNNMAKCQVKKRTQ